MTFKRDLDLQPTIFFYKESKSKKRGGDGRGEGETGERKMDGQTHRPKPICPFNFFEVGGITMH